jgi:hypothetical protein
MDVRSRKFLVRVPVGMRRPFPALKACRAVPLEETCRADSTGIEGVPGVSALAEPAVLRSRGPVALGAANARPGGSAAGNVFNDGAGLLSVVENFVRHRGANHPPSCHQVAHYMPGNIGQPEIASGIPVGEPFMIESEQVE